MNLIDRDKLIEYLEKVTVTDGITFETGFQQILTDIKNEPVIKIDDISFDELFDGSAIVKAVYKRYVIYNREWLAENLDMEVETTKDWYKHLKADERCVTVSFEELKKKIMKGEFDDGK